MRSTDYFQTMARYNRWMNEKIYAVCAAIGDADRKKDMGAFFKSIHGTLNHLLLCDRAWLGRLTGKPFKINYLSDELYADFDELRKERAKTDEELIAWVAALTDERLAADFTYTSAVDNVTRTFPLWAAVGHVFNHQTHHRGQITTLIKQLGIDPGVTDLPWLPGLMREKKA
jgi:uncharacterized damage-inducible protein DinB